MAARAVFSSLTSAIFRTVRRLTTALAMRSATAAWRGITCSAYTRATRSVKERTLRRGKNDRHDRADRRRTVDAHRSAVRLDEGFHDGQADAGPARHARGVGHAIVGLEDAVHDLGRDAAPGVGDLDRDRAAERPGADTDGAAGRRVLDRVRDQIGQDTLE